jgi:hypothetical protein
VIARVRVLPRDSATTRFRLLDRLSVDPTIWPSHFLTLGPEQGELGAFHERDEFRVLRGWFVMPVMPINLLVGGVTSLYVHMK